MADAILYSAKSIEQNRFEGMRQVIDISGDGLNTLGRSLSELRSEVLAAEISINALVLKRPEMPDLPEYFVISSLAARVLFRSKHGITIPSPRRS